MLPTSALLLLLLFIGNFNQLAGLAIYLCILHFTGIFVGVVITQDSSRRSKSHNE